MQLALIVYFLGLLPTAMWLDCCRYLIHGERADVRFSAVGVCAAWPVLVPFVLCLAQLKEWIDGN